MSPPVATNKKLTMQTNCNPHNNTKSVADQGGEPRPTNQHFLDFMGFFPNNFPKSHPPPGPGSESEIDVNFVIRNVQKSQIVHIDLRILFLFLNTKRITIAIVQLIEGVIHHYCQCSGFLRSCLFIFHHICKMYNSD